MAQALLKLHSPDRDVLAEEIFQALGELPSELREAFMLAHYSSIPLEEIARRRGLKESDLEFLISKANRAFFARLRHSKRESLD